MALPNILPPNNCKGFMLLEIIIVMAIMAMVFGLGLFVSFDFYKSYSFNLEKDTLIGILQKARSKSINNIDQKAHGVHVESGIFPTYTLFQCPKNNAPCNYMPNPATDIVISASYGISLESSLPVPFDVVFEQLTGNCINPECLLDNIIITAKHEQKSYHILINNEGRIDY